MSADWKKNCQDTDKYKGKTYISTVSGVPMGTATEMKGEEPGLLLELTSSWKNDTNSVIKHCKQLEIEAMSHVPEQWPEANNRDNSGLCSGQVSDCHSVVQLKCRPNTTELPLSKSRLT